MQALSAGSSESYDGFACMRWERDGERVRLDAYNFEGGCHVNWRGSAERRGTDELDLIVSNPSCVVAGCGSCLYDASFAVDTTTTTLDDSAEIRLIEAPCEGERTSIGSWKLQDGAESSGITCKYARGLEEHSSRARTCGQLHGTCRSEHGICGSVRPGRETLPPCDEGLTCTKAGNAGSMCLMSCTTSDECPLPDILECRDAVCQLK